MESLVVYQGLSGLKNTGVSPLDFRSLFSVFGFEIQMQQEIISPVAEPHRSLVCKGSLFTTKHLCLLQTKLITNETVVSVLPFNRSN